MTPQVLQVNPIIYKALMAELSSSGLTVDEWLQKHIETDRNHKKDPRHNRKFGSSKGMFVVTDEFFEPLGLISL